MVYVPWYLVEVFPNNAALTALQALSRQVRIDGAGAICLSGSSVFRGALQTVGDIDFCEYVTVEPARIPKLIESLIMHVSVAFLARIYIVRAIPRTDFTPPWDGCPLRISELCETAGAPSDAPILMFQYIAPDELLGLLPVTNRMLPVAARQPSAGHGQTTFVFQEAVFTKDDPPPRTLVAPAEIADYVIWLRD
jgi:hypothetical protein